MKYDHRLVQQESEHEGHVPTEDDFFIVENFGRDDAIYWKLKSLLLLHPHTLSREMSFNRSKDWLKENHPELFL